MKKTFFIKLICFMLSLLIIPSAYFFYVQSKPAVFRRSLMGSVNVKLSILQQTEGERIILLGGSSVPYSIQCESVSKAAGKPCISMGATAYLGLEYYYYLIKDEIRAGDIIIIAPEFSMLSNSVNYTTVWTAVENSEQLLTRLPLSYIPPMAKSFYNYSLSKLDLIKNGRPEKSELEQYYEAGFGPYGDIVTYRETLLESGYDKNNTYSITQSSLSEEAVRATNKFCDFAQKKGCSVYITWAPFDKLAFQSSIRQLAEFEKTLKNEIKAEYVGNMTDCLMDEKYFYDSNNHLTTSGAQLRTEIFISDFLAAGVF